MKAASYPRGNKRNARGSPALWATPGASPARSGGPLPDWADQHLSQAGTEQLEAWALRVLDEKSLEAILRGSPGA